jgi:hypothetical protein
MVLVFRRDFTLGAHNELVLVYKNVADIDGFIQQTSAIAPEIQDNSF